MDKSPYLQVTQANVLQQGTLQLANINFSAYPGQQWAIVGYPEASKTVFLQAIAGKATVTHGAIRHGYADEYLQQPDGKDHRTHYDLISYVTFHHHFRNKQNIQGFYYQQRFNSMDADDAATVSEYLHSIHPKHNQIRWTPQQVTELFRLQPLADKTLIKLSNGETRRLMLAAALVKNPALLLLDKPLVGLDVETRQHFDQLLDTVIQSGICVIMTTTIAEIPAGITHVAVVQDSRIIAQGPKNQLNLKAYQTPPANSPAMETIGKTIQRLLPGRPHTATAPIVSMTAVHIQYGDKVVLDDINWQVNSGEAWALQGHNGAGKSTLLSLINGDNPQAYRNNITLFGRRRGTGESIWDIKKQIGYVSPELHQYFPNAQTALQVVLSGFFDTIGLFRKTSANQRETALQWLELFGLSSAAHQRLVQLSPDRQRLCLLARAVVKNPQLLILDEPCQGLDLPQRNFFKVLVDEIHASAHATLIYVSHYAEDIPSCVNRYIKLANGKVAEITQ